jgi:hypothetical protein
MQQQLDLATSKIPEKESELKCKKKTVKGRGYAYVEIKLFMQKTHVLPGADILLHQVSTYWLLIPQRL